MSKEHIAADVRLPGYTEQQVQRAVASMLKFVGNQKSKANDLFDDDEILNIQIAMKKMPLQSRKDKPIALSLPHPLLSVEGAEICLFVKDHAGEGHKEGKAMISKFEKSGGINKVIGISKLKTKYESHEAKRQLCKMYDIFLADDRILPSLPKLIGKSFFRKKKQPVPIRVTSSLPDQVKKACSCTYMFKNSGTCINIKAGLSSFTQQQVVENIHAVLVQAIQHIPKKWANVRAIYLKSVDSVALPLFQTLPEQGTKIEAITSPVGEANETVVPDAVGAKKASSIKRAAPSAARSKPKATGGKKRKA